jgi:hypothetical protein
MDRKMMNAWLAAQANNNPMKVLHGVVPQAQARTKAGMCATDAATLSEQLNAEEEAYAKEHKDMLGSMIKQYGKEKGTKVFYATVRNKVRGK